MKWQNIKETLYYWDGSWRDIYIPNTTIDDWKKWIDFVNSQYKIDWFNGRTSQDEDKIDFEVIQEYWNGNLDLCSTAKVFVDKIQINSHFFQSGEIENDIDPREFNSIEDHNKLLDYMKKLSILLTKQIVLTPENGRNIILITVDRDDVIINEDIDPSKWVINLR